VYKGTTTINFSTDRNKNVTVFLGQNGLGKSTLIQSFVWAIYDDKLRLPDPTRIMNFVTLSEMHTGSKESVYVKVELIHDGVTYEFSRTIDYECTDIGKLKAYNEEWDLMYYDEVDGEKKHVKDAKLTRERILPSDLHEFFFFDGEHVKDIYAGKEKASISKLMGILPLKNSAYDVNKAYEHFLSMVSETGDNRLRVLNVRLSEAKQAYEKADSECNHYEDQLERARLDYMEAETKFLEISQASDVVNQLKKVESRKNNKEKDISEALVECSKVFRDTYQNIFAYSLEKDAQKYVDEAIINGVVDEGVPGMNASSIEYILKRGRCICGANLSQHPDMIECIKKEQTYLPPESIGTELKAFNDVCKSNINHASVDKSNFIRSFEHYEKVLDEYDDICLELKELEYKVKNQDNDEIIRITDDYKNKKVRYSDLNSNISNWKAKRISADKDVKRAQNDIEDFAAQDEKNKLPRLCAEYSKILYGDIMDTVKRREEIDLREFNDRLNEIFKKMYHGERNIVVNSDYKIDTVLEGFGPIASSTGTEVVLSIAFISTLLNLARERLENVDPDIKTEAYPLVMDAVSSNLDETHVENIFRYLPNIAEQVIVFTMKKDWIYAEPVIKDHLDKVYCLEKMDKHDRDIFTKIVGVETNV
jgi:DNA sulfur modification protein DndD